MSYAPALLPKIRSEALLQAVRGMPCTLRVASFIPGHRCAPDSTVVPCHVGRVGKGMATKVSDLFVAAGCMHCHDLVDMRDSRWKYLADHHGAQVHQRVLAGLMETQTMLVMRGAIVIPGADDMKALAS